MSIRYLVYGLFDPQTSELRYVGKTKQVLGERLRRHQRDALEKTENTWTDHTHRACWLRKVLFLGLSPEVEILQETATLEEANDSEVFWISYYKSIGCELTNSTAGGDGGIVSRKPTCTDEAVIEMYQSGLSTGQIAKSMKTCKKRILTVLNKNNFVRATALQKEVVDENGNKYSSITAAGKALGLTCGAVSNMLCGKSKTVAGHTFRYL